MTWENLA